MGMPRATHMIKKYDLEVSPKLSPLDDLKALYKQEGKVKAELKACLNRHTQPLGRD